MTPVGRNVGQRPHDESPLGGARMRHRQTWLGDDGSTECDKVEIERARCVRSIAATPEFRLEREQRGHDLSGRKLCLDKDDTVEIVRTRLVGPSDGAPPP